jgi:hypothetical protein
VVPREGGKWSLPMPNAIFSSLRHIICHIVLQYSLNAQCDMCQIITYAFIFAVRRE